MLAHTIKGYLVNKRVVRDKANNTVTALQTVSSPTEELNITIVELVGETDALKGLILAYARVEFMLNIERSDIVRQQHNFIAEKIMLIFVFQSMGRDAMQQVHHVTAGANAGINDLHPWL